MKIEIGNLTLDGKKLFLIAGPCVIESEKFALETAKKLRDIAAKRKIPFIYKSSYDKANRSSGKSFRGVGLKAGLEILNNVRDKVGVPVLTDVHQPFEAVEAGKVVDCLQIPAFLCRQTDLLLAAGESGVAVNVKKGQFLSPEEMKNVVEKVASTGNENILLTERGTFFGYGRLVVDMTTIPIMQKFGVPVVIDATHAVQRPGGLGDRTGGDRTLAPYIAKAAVAVGCDGVFTEVHPNPDKAPSDGPNMLRMQDLPKLLDQLLAIRKAIS